MAQIRIHRDGTVETLSGTQDIGGGARTVVLIQTSAAFGNLPLARIRVQIGRSDFGASGASAGSSTTASVSREVELAAKKVKKELLALIARSFGCEPDEVVLGDGGTFTREGHDQTLKWGEACALIKDRLVAQNDTLLEPGSEWYVLCPERGLLQATQEDYKA